MARTDGGSYGEDLRTQLSPYKGSGGRALTWDQYCNQTWRTWIEPGSASSGAVPECWEIWGMGKHPGPVEDREGIPGGFGMGTGQNLGIPDSPDWSGSVADMFRDEPGTMATYNDAVRRVPIQPGERPGMVGQGGADMSVDTRPDRPQPVPSGGSTIMDWKLLLVIAAVVGYVLWSRNKKKKAVSGGKNGLADNRGPVIPD